MTWEAVEDRVVAGESLSEGLERGVVDDFGRNGGARRGGVVGSGARDDGYAGLGGGFLKGCNGGGSDVSAGLLCTHT